MSQDPGSVFYNSQPPPPVLAQPQDVVPLASGPGAHPRLVLLGSAACSAVSLLWLRAISNYIVFSSSINHMCDLISTSINAELWLQKIGLVLLLASRLWRMTKARKPLTLNPNLILGDRRPGTLHMKPTTPSAQRSLAQQRARDWGMDSSMKVWHWKGDGGIQDLLSPSDRGWVASQICKQSTIWGKLRGPKEVSLIIGQT